MTQYLAFLEPARLWFLLVIPALVGGYLLRVRRTRMRAAGVGRTMFDLVILTICSEFDLVAVSFVVHVQAYLRRVVGPDELQRASRAFAAVYEWPTRVAGDELDADYGAPTSGGPPYQVYAITPSKAFGLPTDGESLAPTRWRFS